MTWGRAAGVVAVLVPLAFGGCGGGGGDATGGSCGKIAPCGGDVTGSWTAAGSCFDSDNFLAYILVGYEPGCPAGSAPTLTS